MLSLRRATASRVGVPRVGVIQTGYLEVATPGRPQQSLRRRSANRRWTSFFNGRERRALEEPGVRIPLAPAGSWPDRLRRPPHAPGSKGPDSCSSRARHPRRSRVRYKFQQIAKLTRSSGCPSPDSPGRSATARRPYLQPYDPLQRLAATDHAVAAPATQLALIRHLLTQGRSWTAESD
jgi:hypothetical protein